jgi:hypothetical protein
MEAMGQPRTNKLIMLTVMSVLTIAFISFLPLNCFLLSFVSTNLQKECQRKQIQNNIINTAFYKVKNVLSPLVKWQKMAKWPSDYLLVGQRGDCGLFNA